MQKRIATEFGFRWDELNRGHRTLKRTFNSYTNICRRRRQKLKHRDKMMKTNETKNEKNIE